MSVGKRIALAREALGLSKTQLSKKMNVSYQTITDWEEGNNTPRPTRFEKLAKVLRAPSEWLILGQGEYSPDDSPPDSCQITSFNSQTASSFDCEIDENNQLIKKIELKRKWLNEVAANDDENSLSIITYFGDRMSPTLTSGDILLVDHSVCEITFSSIYVVTLNGKLYINRFDYGPDKKLHMNSDNQFYANYIIQEDDDFEVIGRVILRLNPTRI